MLAVLVDGHLPSVEVGDVAELLEVGVGVTAEDDVDAACLRNGAVVTLCTSCACTFFGWAVVPSEVADADDEVALLLLLQQLHHLIGTGSRVEVPDSCAVGGCHETFELWTEGEDADLDVAASDDGVGFHDAFEDGAGEVVVGAEDGEVRLALRACTFSSAARRRC